MQLNDRFWSKVDKTGHGPGACWEWTAGLDPNGYGRFGVGSRRDNTIRKAYIHRLVMGEPDQQVRHRCDNRKCCNPDHLDVGTPADNTEDMVSRGRVAVGENMKMTPGRVVELRLRAHLGESQQDLAKDYGIHHRTVGKIVTRKTWQYLSNPC